MGSNNEHTLIIDFTEEFVSISLGGDYSFSELRSEDFWDQPQEIAKQFNEFIKEAGLPKIDCLMACLPIKKINYQVVTLPEEMKEKERLVLLGLELDPKKIGKRFNYTKLPVTQRNENGDELCDYMVIAPKPGIYEALSIFAKEVGIKLIRVVPSFYLLAPGEKEDLTSTAWVGEDRTEVVIWGRTNPLAMATIANTGDQMGDISRFVIEYFDHVPDLSISMVRLYGPRMKDAAISYGLTYPHEILDDPHNALARSLGNAAESLDISLVTKLPKPPIEMNPRNITFIASAVLVMVLLIVSSFYQSSNLRLNSQLKNLQTKAEKFRKLNSAAKKLEKDKLTLITEKDFYLNITKRRTPWHKILVELAELTPQEMWLERFSGTKTNVQLGGKARTSDDISSFSINLNNSSKYFKEAKIIGVRDFEQARQVYTEFQLSTSLKPPSGRFFTK